MSTKDIFDKAYEDYADALFRHCYFRVSNRDVALELTQDTFMKTWDALSKGSKIRNIKAFLFQVLRNLIIDYYRKKRDESLDALLEENKQENSFPDLQDNASDERYRLDTLSDIKKLRQAIEELPEKYKEVIILRHIDEMTVKEIAKILKEKENNVSVRINRAKEKLKSILEKKDIRKEL